MSLITTEPAVQAPATTLDRDPTTEGRHRRNGRPYRLDQFDRDAELKRALRTLQIENGQLKRLVIQLSETIVKNVVGSRNARR